MIASGYQLNTGGTPGLQTMWKVMQWFPQHPQVKVAAKVTRQREGAGMQKSVIVATAHPCLAHAHHCSTRRLRQGLQWKVHPFTFLYPLQSLTPSKLRTGMTAKMHDLKKLFCTTQYIYSEWYWNIASTNQKGKRNHRVYPLLCLIDRRYLSGWMMNRVPI